MNALLPGDRVEMIKERANTVLARYKSVQDPFDRLRKIAAEHGVEVLEAELYDISGTLTREGDGWKIYVNRQDSPQRQLFTVAHELGHFFVHGDKCSEFVDGQFVARDDDENTAEAELEANEFAGNLIMPEEKVRAAVGEDVGGGISVDSITSLARRFGVSTLAMAIRLKNLGYAVPGI